MSPVSWLSLALLPALCSYVSGHGFHGGLEDFDGESDPANQLRRNEFVENREHIREHMQGQVDIDLDNASEDELEFHFFKIHDYNNDNNLDGIELLHAISHGLDEQIERVQQIDTITQEEKDRRLQRIKNRHVMSVDRILSEDDRNGNGYLDYTEYVSSRRANRLIKSGAKHFSS